MLIDANVWSELSRRRPDAQVVEWMRTHFGTSIMSAIVLGELRYGVALAEGERRRDLTAFLDDLLFKLATPILPFDEAAASTWGTMRARLKTAGLLFGERDMLIAAQALALDVPIVTRNVSEMARSGATIINPWQP